MFQYGKISLNSSNNTYYPGQVISGTLEFSLETPQDFTAIVVQFTGEANVDWEEDRGERYTGNEEYFNVIQPLLGGNGVITSLPAGPHKLEFQYQIPFNIPSSYEGDKGSVIYRIRGHADAPRQTIEKKFKVVSVADLNVNEDAKVPIDLEFEEVYSCCLCTSDPLSVRVSIPSSGFCPGQAVPVSVRVSNKSSVEVRQIKFMITCRESYHSKTPISDYICPEHIMSEATLGAILTKSEREYSVDLRVPDMVVANLERCSLLDEEYFFNVEIKVSGCNDDISDSAPILLGNVPLLGNHENYKHPRSLELPEGPVPTPQPLSTSQYVPKQSMPFSYTSTTPFTKPPHSPQNTPYPYTQINPYPNPQTTPYPIPQNTPYPNPQNTPYPNLQNNPYPNNTPYPNPQTTPYPNPQTTPYPNSQTTPFPNPQTTPYPNPQTTPYPNSQTTPYPNPQVAPYTIPQPHHQINMQWNGSRTQPVSFSVQPNVTHLPSAPPS